MGEIDRINPVARPVLGLPATERVQPESDRHHHHQPQEDKLELHDEEIVEEPKEPEEPRPADPEHGLDLSI